MSVNLEPISVETKRTNEKKEVIQSYSKVDVVVAYYWNAHGNLVHWSDHVDEFTEWSGVDAQIIRYSFTEEFFGNSYDFATKQLFINDKVVAGELEDCTVQFNPASNKTTLYCRVVVGWG